MIPDNDTSANGAVMTVPSGDATIVDAMDELKALTNVMEALRAVNGDSARSRILVAASSFYKLDPQVSAQHSGSNGQTHTPAAAATSLRTFSEERAASPKDFLMQKQPRTDVEKVACLAYFLTHYRDTPAFKTIDISKLNTDAAQPKFSNAAMAVDNATKSLYLVPALKGNKQISAMGESFVQALPDREAAKAAMSNGLRPRRRKRAGKGQVQVAQEVVQ